MVKAKLILSLNYFRSTLTYTHLEICFTANDEQNEN
jgi:hypothetical protein